MLRLLIELRTWTIRGWLMIIVTGIWTWWRSTSCWWWGRGRTMTTIGATTPTRISTSSVTSVIPVSGFVIVPSSISRTLVITVFLSVLLFRILGFRTGGFLFVRSIVSAACTGAVGCGAFVVGYLFKLVEKATVVGKQIYCLGQCWLLVLFPINKTSVLTSIECRNGLKGSSHMDFF